MGGRLSYLHLIKKKQQQKTTQDILFQSVTTKGSGKKPNVFRLRTGKIWITESNLEIIIADQNVSEKSVPWQRGEIDIACLNADIACLNAETGRTAQSSCYAKEL